MAVTVSINGTNYQIPQTSEVGWGDNLTQWIQAVSSGLLQRSGGSFILTSEVDFGNVAGIKTLYYKSQQANPSASGVLRLGNTESVGWRNGANSSDLLLSVSSDRIRFSGIELIDLSSTQTLTNKSIDGLTNTLTNVPYSSLNLTGLITNADIAAAAAIQFSKMESLTASRVLQTSASGVVEPSDITATELSHLSGVISGVQAQIDNRVITPVSTDNAVARYDGTTGQVQNSGVTVDDSNNLNVPGSVVVQGDLTVNGTTVTLNTATLDVEDKNITVNALGTDASAEGAGLTVDRVGTNGSLIYADAQASKFRIGAQGAEVEVADIGTAQTFTNKTLTAPLLEEPVIDDGVDFIEEATLANPSSGRRRLGLKTDGKLYLRDSSGNEKEIGSGGGSGINYIANADAETDTTGWVTYKDAAGLVPVDGTGGSPTMTWTRTTSSPLRGLASFLLTKPASNTQGEGVSYDFEIDSADKAKVLQIDFDYEVASGTYASDVHVYVVDTVNNTVIQPSAFIIEPTLVQAQARLTFQTASNSTSYRLVLHQAGNGSNQYTLKLDNIQLGPQVVPLGAPVTDWVSYTPSLTTSGGGAVTLNATSAVQPWGRWRRVGDSVEIHGGFRNGSGGAASGAAGIVKFSQPPGIARDVVSTSGVSDNIVGVYLGPAYASSVTTLPIGAYEVFSDNNISFADTGGGTVNVSDLAANYPLSFTAKFKVAGWSSSTVVSSSADTRVVALTSSGTPTGGASLGAFIVFPAPSVDTHAGYNATTGVYTVRVGGLYRVSVVVNATNTAAIGANRNGSTAATLALTSAGFGTGSALVQLAVGDQFGITTSANLGAFSQSNLSLERISGPSQIAASEVIAVRGISPSAGSFASETTVVYTTKTHDTHNAYNTSTGVFTAPAPGYYRIHARYLTQSVAQGTTGAATIRYRINNGTPFEMSWTVGSGGNINQSVSGTDTVWLNAGWTLDFRASSSSTTSMNSGHFTIERLGGVG